MRNVADLYWECLFLLEDPRRHLCKSRRQLFIRRKGNAHRVNIKTDSPSVSKYGTHFSRLQYPPTIYFTWQPQQRTEQVNVNTRRIRIEIIRHARLIVHWLYRRDGLASSINLHYVFLQKSTYNGCPSPFEKCHVVIAPIYALIFCIDAIHLMHGEHSGESMVSRLQK